MIFFFRFFIGGTNALIGGEDRLRFLEIGIPAKEPIKVGQAIVFVPGIAGFLCRLFEFGFFHSFFVDFLRKRIGREIFEIQRILAILDVKVDSFDGLADISDGLIFLSLVNIFHDLLADMVICWTYL
jgi:hypothetical protein